MITSGACGSGIRLLRRSTAWGDPAADAVFKSLRQACFVSGKVLVYSWDGVRPRMSSAQGPMRRDGFGLSKRMYEGANHVHSDVVDLGLSE